MADRYFLEVFSRLSAIGLRDPEGDLLRLTATNRDRADATTYMDVSIADARNFAWGILRQTDGQDLSKIPVRQLHAIARTDGTGERTKDGTYIEMTVDDPDANAPCYRFRVPEGAAQEAVWGLNSLLNSDNRVEPEPIDLPEDPDTIERDQRLVTKIEALLAQANGLVNEARHRGLTIQTATVGQQPFRIHSAGRMYRDGSKGAGMSPGVILSSVTSDADPE